MQVGGRRAGRQPIEQLVRDRLHARAQLLHPPSREEGREQGAHPGHDHRDERKDQGPGHSVPDDDADAMTGHRRIGE